jgi:hypothetical protein
MQGLHHKSARKPLAIYLWISSQSGPIENSALTSHFIQPLASTSKKPVQYEYGQPLPQGHDWLGVIYQFLIALKSAFPKR